MSPPPYYWRDQAFRAVDACGGTYTPEQIASGYAAANKDALDAACDALTCMGAMDPPARTQALLEALQDLLIVVDYVAIRSGWPDNAARHKARAAIKAATGEG